MLRKSEASIEPCDLGQRKDRMPDLGHSDSWRCIQLNNNWFNRPRSRKNRLKVIYPII